MQPVEDAPELRRPTSTCRAASCRSRACARSSRSQEPLARFLYSLPVRHESLLKPEATSTPATFRTIHRLLDAAAARGDLRADVPVDLMCVHVHDTIEAGMRAWAAGCTDEAVNRVEVLVELAVDGIAARR